MAALYVQFGAALANYLSGGLLRWADVPLRITRFVVTQRLTLLTFPLYCGSIYRRHRLFSFRHDGLSCRMVLLVEFGCLLVLRYPFVDLFGKDYARDSSRSVNLELDCACDRHLFRFAPTLETILDQMALIAKMLLPSWVLRNKTPA